MSFIFVAEKQRFPSYVNFFFCSRDSLYVPDCIPPIFYWFLKSETWQSDLNKNHRYIFSGEKWAFLWCAILYFLGGFSSFWGVKLCKNQVLNPLAAKYSALTDILVNSSNRTQKQNTLFSTSLSFFGLLSVFY